MGEIELFNPPALPAPSGYAHAARASGLVFVSGQIGCDESGRVPEPADLPRQFERAIRNVATALSAAGSGTEDVLKITYLVTDVAAYRRERRAIGEAYRSAFGRHYPASTLLEVRALFDPDALVEIECVAVRRE